MLLEKWHKNGHKTSSAKSIVSAKHKKGHVKQEMSVWQSSGSNVEYLWTYFVKGKDQGSEGWTPPVPLLHSEWRKQKVRGRPDEGQVIKWHEGESNQGCWCPGELTDLCMGYLQESLVHDPCLPMGHIEAQKSGKKSERDMETGKIPVPFPGVKRGLPLTSLTWLSDTERIHLWIVTLPQRSKIHNLLGQENILIFTKPPTNLFLWRKCFDLTWVYGNVAWERWLGNQRTQVAGLAWVILTTLLLGDLSSLLYLGLPYTLQGWSSVHIRDHWYINFIFFFGMGNTKKTLH